MGRIIDISQMLKPGMAVWPGDAEFKAFWSTTQEESGSVNVGGVSMSLHSGTHTDAPKHFRAGDKSIAEVDLDLYVGEALVLDMTRFDPHAISGGIGRAHIETALAQYEGTVPPRVLVKTGTGGASGMFPEAFAHFTGESAQALIDAGVRLVGIDTPSVDHVTSKDLPAHHVFADHGVAIVENLALSHVEPGRYELIALPLKLSEMDASPVRAVLRELE